MPKYETTPWTPELIPDQLPPNVDPPLQEPVYRKNGEVIRTTQERRHEAVCLDPTCPLMWEGMNAFPSASAHTANTGHLTRLYYAAEFTLGINPHHPKHRGRVKVVLLPSLDTPSDLPEHVLEAKRARLAPTPPRREPEVNQDTEQRHIRTARKRSIQAMVSDDAQTVLKQVNAEAEKRGRGRAKPKNARNAKSGGANS